jgi:hypothetical protein
MHTLPVIGEVEVRPGHPVELPPSVRAALTPGRWRLQLSPVPEGSAPRTHDAFLNSYTDADEGLYDDVTRG